MAVVDLHLRKRFIRTTSASINKRGMHYLLAYIRRDMREDPEGTRYCYKFDITKFYAVSYTHLSVGRHTVQMVAEMDAGDGLTLKSESIHSDILKSGSSVPYVGLMVTHRDGRILTGADHLSPVIEVGQ